MESREGSQTLSRVQVLVDRGQIRISAHGYDELAADDIFIGDVIAGYARTMRSRIAVVWGIPENRTGPAVVVTAYRPDPARWSSDFLRRKTP
jgi:hypothetical protein